LDTNAARTVVGTDVGYQPSVLKPIVEMVFASDFISFEDWIAQLSLSRSFPLAGICARQLIVKVTNKLKVMTIRVFILQAII
jgi:hypothetical protein